MIKICGLTNPEDAVAAVEGGATGIGVNFYPRSPRYLDPQAAARLFLRLPSAILKVGVFVNEPPARVVEIARIAGLDVAQLHGDESEAEFPVGLRIWKALRVDADFDRLTLRRYAGVEALLLDGPAGAGYGGAGKPFAWGLAAELPQRIVLAGGLDADNVGLAIRQARPWGVDACSRLESSPGRKDCQKMLAFLKAAQAAELDRGAEVQT